MLVALLTLFRLAEKSRWEKSQQLLSTKRVPRARNKQVYGPADCCWLSMAHQLLLFYHPCQTNIDKRERERENNTNKTKVEKDKNGQSHNKRDEGAAVSRYRSPIRDIRFRLRRQQSVSHIKPHLALLLLPNLLSAFCIVLVGWVFVRRGKINSSQLHTSWLDLTADKQIINVVRKVRNPNTRTNSNP